ncbi:di-heme-cytochrome C peroxidase [Marinagarivorans algicola]|uniref:di-heme-cytochrome C peroxidase n=1 Tax=Marinagarivorans algicola TaxID=1513270 RepID=UPI0006B5F673|nr:di-heme-cytochrome C peroxidase [Marinagarivorans algicola]
MKIRLGRLALIAVMAAGVLTGCTGEPEYLDQNWTEENQLRDKFYTTSQGSQLIPYEWFFALENAKSHKLISSHDEISLLGYLPDYVPDPLTNPDGLPVGFVKDEDPQTGDWLGVNCAACHTAQFTYKQHVVRIDGAPSMGDFIKLYRTVRDSLDATLASRQKFRRFAKRLRLNYSESRAVYAQMKKIAAELDGTIERGVSKDHEPGYGRVDAFSGIRNEVFQHDLGIKENFRPSIAPVSYPFLWGTPDLQAVQWTGNADNPFGRNAGQVLGVLGRLDLKNPATLFESSIRRDNVFLMEQWVRELKAPKWPAHILGRIDQAAAQRGRALYNKVDASGYSCASCHALKNAKGQYPLTPASDNAFGKQFVKTTNIPLDEIGTDPNAFLTIYAQGDFKTGGLAPLLGGETEMFGPTLLTQIGGGVVRKLFQASPALTPQQQAVYSGFRVYAPGVEAPAYVPGYKARPLEGIWATSPYLHNGSVPTLHDLLLPPSERPSIFWVGNYEFDPVSVGYVTDNSFIRYKGVQARMFRFDTTRAGNYNSGHEYGTHLSRSQRWDLVEFLKTL